MRLKAAFLTLIFIIIHSAVYAQRDCVAFGTLKNNAGKPVTTATIAVQGSNQIVSINKQGEFEIIGLPCDKTIKIAISDISHHTEYIEITPTSGVREEIHVELKERELKEVEVKYKYQDEKREQVSLIKVDPRQTQNLPSVFGDFNKVLSTLPGVSSNNELSSTYSVRGGNYDENLVYVNGMPIYRPFLVSSGQQEGLSFVNSSLVSDVEFSSGGWQPRYGDKLSSVLAIEYKTPTQFGGSVTGSMLGGGFHLEGASPNKRLTFVGGLRYKDSRRALRGLDTGAEFRPWFIDYQSFMRYDLTNKERHPNQIKTSIGLLTSYAKNSYLIIPQTKETNFGNFNQSKRFLVAYSGQETMSYDSYQNGLKLDHRFDSTLKFNIIISQLYTREREFFDIEGYYQLCDVSLDPSTDEFNKCVFTQDIGSEYKHGRNQLNAEIYNLQSNWEHALSDKSTVEWGVNYSSESISDKLDQYNFIDSSFFVGKLETLFTDLTLNSNRFGGFAQHTIQIDSNKTFTYGVRSSYWDVNKQVTISPRAQFSIKPRWKRDILFKTAAGIYHQPPFYRELRNDSGQLNTALRAQMSTHLIAGMDYNFKMWSRDFKLTSEIYHKQIFDAMVYDIDDVKIRYKANNDAIAYAYGVDFRINGEFIKGAESWFSLGLLRTREKLNDDAFLGIDSLERHAGYVPRPMDQLVMIGVFFQDHLPNNPTWRMYLNGTFGSGLPFNIPGVPKYTAYEYQGTTVNAETGNEEETTLSARSLARMPAYRRVDIGISKMIAFNIDEDIKSNGIRSVWIGLEVLNVLTTQNTLSYTWVKDLYGVRYAIPNYLSARLLNLKAIVKF